MTVFTVATPWCVYSPERWAILRRLLGCYESVVHMQQIETTSLLGICVLLFFASADAMVNLCPDYDRTTQLIYLSLSGVGRKRVAQRKVMYVLVLLAAVALPAPSRAQQTLPSITRQLGTRRRKVEKAKSCTWKKIQRVIKRTFHQ